MMTQHNEHAQRIATPAATRAILKQHNIQLKKSLGQNFLTDENILRKIIKAAEISDKDGVLEIGPGIGALTQHLAEAADQVVAIEIDERLTLVLDKLFGTHPNVAIVPGDILEIDLESLITRYFSDVASLHVVANLPYYITTPILLKLLHTPKRFDHLVVMIQKEVAERMAAKPGGKEYGSLSIAVQFYSEPELVMHVPPTVFIPPPKVGSAIIRLKMREQPPVHVSDVPFFFEVVRASFAQRRKTIYNNLKHHFYDKEDTARLNRCLEKAEIDRIRRGETLTIEEFARLSEVLLHDLK